MFTMKFISVSFLLVAFWGCSSLQNNVNGDCFLLHINSTDDYKNYQRETVKLEHLINLKKIRSYNQIGLHFFIYSSAEANLYYYFIPESLQMNAFFINNIQGVNTCGMLSIDESLQNEIFNYEVENFPYVEISRNGVFPLKGEKNTYPHVLGYRLFESGQRKYFSYYIFSETNVNKFIQVGFPRYPAIIDEYEKFVKKVRSSISSDASRNACWNL